MGQAKHTHRERFSLPNEGWSLEHFVNMNWVRTATEPYYSQVSIGTQYSPSQWAYVLSVPYTASYAVMAIFNMAKIERTVRIRHKHTATLKYRWIHEIDPIYSQLKPITETRGTEWITRTITVPAAGFDAVPADREIICPLKSTTQFTKETIDVPLSNRLDQELYNTSRKFGVVFLWLELYHQRFLKKSKDVNYTVEILGRTGLPVQSIEGNGVTYGSVVPW